MEFKKLNVHDNSELTSFMEENGIKATYANYKFLREHYESIYDMIQEDSEISLEDLAEESLTESINDENIPSTIETLTEENLLEIFGFGKKVTVKLKDGTTRTISKREYNKLKDEYRKELMKKGLEAEKKEATPEVKPETEVKPEPKPDGDGAKIPPRTPTDGVGTILKSIPKMPKMELPKGPSKLAGPMLQNQAQNTVVNSGINHQYGGVMTGGNYIKGDVSGAGAFSVKGGAGSNNNGVINNKQVNKIGNDQKIEVKNGTNITESLAGLTLEEACNVLVRNEISHSEITSILTEQYGSEIGDSISAFTQFTEHIEKTIKICEEVKAKEEKAAEEAAAKEPTQAPDEMAFGKQLTVAPDGSMSVEAPGTIIAVAPDRTLQISLAENRHSNRILKYYLTEDCGMSLNEFVNLSEETKIMSLKEVVGELLKTIEDKLGNIDTSVADRSHGDVRKLPELNNLQDAITKIEALIERDYNSLPQYTSYIGTVIKSILYLNQYSGVFKDAYRNKKTVLIMKYQSVILSIISSVSYFLSVAIDYNDRGNIGLKKNVDVNLMEFAPLKALDGFVKSVESGEFKMLVGDTNMLREFYLEHSVETMGSILEASDYIPMIVDGVKNLYNSLTNDGKIVEVLYKAAGVFVLLLSLRDVFYTLFKTKTKVADMLSNIGIFANLNNGGNSLGKLSQFASKFANDAEFGSDVAKREIEDENKRVYNKVQTIQSTKSVEPTETVPENGRIVKASSWDEFDF